MTKKFYKGEKLVCPHCDTEQPYYVEDYVIAGQMGPLAKGHEECEHCYQPFTVMAESADEFLVETA